MIIRQEHSGSSFEHVGLLSNSQTGHLRRIEVADTMKDQAYNPD
jgi:hypothetical protein